MRGIYSYLHNLGFLRTDFVSIINEYCLNNLPENSFTFEQKCNEIQKDFKSFKTYIKNKFIK